VTDLQVIVQAEHSAVETDCSREELLWLAAAVEARSEHSHRARHRRRSQATFHARRALHEISVRGGVMASSADVAGRRIAVGT